MSTRRLVALGLAAVAIVAAISLGQLARSWNAELGIVPALERVPPIVADPHTPRLARRVLLVVVDGLGADEAALPFLDELRARGADAIARVPYPTVSRPNYVTILTGVPPRDSGVRANRVSHEVRIDSVMARARAAGLASVTASDYGSLASLFPDAAFADVQRAGSLDELSRLLASLDARAAFVAVLVLDVDRAGHAAGVGAEYRAAAVAVDRMLRAVVARLDLARDAVIVTADHGHVARGGHGGNEPEVSHVPLVLAGAGVVAGSHAHDAELVDIAPTIAALLGIPSPGHAEGTTLVALLALDPAAAARRTAADGARSAAITYAVQVPDPRPLPGWLAATIAGVIAAVVLAIRLRRRAALALGVRALAGLTAFGAVLAALAVITAGQLSPSYVPSLARLEREGAIALLVAVAAQLVVVWLAVRRVPDRLAAANGIALVGITCALATAGAVRAWFAPPRLAVPSPAWMVLVPALEIAAAATCATLALAVLAAAARARGR